jgi:phosphoglycolate phosphatase
MNSFTCELFIFDLDGTLIDSRADITFSLNNMLARIDLPPLHVSSVDQMVGMGVKTLIERALHEITELEPEEPTVEKCVTLFREEYGNHLLDKTCLFPHVIEALDYLDWAEFAVVTNKPETFSRRILEGLGIAGRFSIILGGDSVQQRKPHPEALIKAMEFCRVSPSQAAMIGDSAVDIEAGKAAGVITCGVLGGFRPRQELESTGCDMIINNLLELSNFFCPPDRNK